MYGRLKKEGREGAHARSPSLSLPLSPSHSLSCTARPLTNATSSTNVIGPIVRCQANLSGSPAIFVVGDLLKVCPTPEKGEPLFPFGTTARLASIIAFFSFFLLRRCLLIRQVGSKLFQSISSLQMFLLLDVFLLPF
jgi:hypothetical protein